MWKEPNFPHFFSGSLDQYIDAILPIGAQTVRDADPDGLGAARNWRRRTAGRRGSTPCSTVPPRRSTS
jgi:hypothetical protein